MSTDIDLCIGEIAGLKDRSIIIPYGDISLNPLKYAGCEVPIVADYANSLINGTEFPEKGSFVDPRNNVTYRTVRYENMEIMVDTLYFPIDYDSFSVNNGICDVMYYSRITDTLAPEGWHVMRYSELTWISNYFGGPLCAGKYMKVGKYDLGLSFVPFGSLEVESGQINDLQRNAYCLLENNSTVLWLTKFDNNVRTGSVNGPSPVLAFPVRCVRD
ncbi:MAG: hypothetical protein MJZ25_08960 [Fibrobacter sp.]|nr:hypothetical protein [Fibrobacter sp.]